MKTSGLLLRATVFLPGLIIAILAIQPAGVFAQAQAPKSAPSEVKPPPGGPQSPLQRTTVTGSITDVEGGKPVSVRLYIEGANGFQFAESNAPGGEAIRYDKQARVNPRAIERHTSLSAHPFRVSLTPGKYRFTAERGPEYLPATKEITV